jgi:hypothetical protein
VDVEMLEQDAGLAGVFTGDEIDRFQRFNSPERHIAQVPNRCGDEVQHSGLMTWGDRVIGTHASHLYTDMAPGVQAFKHFLDEGVAGRCASEQRGFDFFEDHSLFTGFVQGFKHDRVVLFLTSVRHILLFYGTGGCRRKQDDKGKIL